MKEINIKNIYKPRYRVAAQASNKTYLYKNSRLRGFFNIRAEKIIRGSLYRAYFIVQKALKWTVARRYIAPRLANRSTLICYKNSFYEKQITRAHYGWLLDDVIAKYVRNKAFIASLESRLDIIIFRIRFLPTIFACSQYIKFRGININNKTEYSPNALLRVGDCASFANFDHIRSILTKMRLRVYYRRWGLYINVRRKRKQLHLTLRRSFRSTTRGDQSLYEMHKAAVKAYWEGDPAIIQMVEEKRFFERIEEAGFKIAAEREKKDELESKSKAARKKEAAIKRRRKAERNSKTALSSRRKVKVALESTRKSRRKSQITRKAAFKIRGQRKAALESKRKSRRAKRIGRAESKSKAALKSKSQRRANIKRKAKRGAKKKALLEKESVLKQEAAIKSKIYAETKRRAANKAALNEAIALKEEAAIKKAADNFKELETRIADWREKDDWYQKDREKQRKDPKWCRRPVVGYSRSSARINKVKEKIKNKLKNPERPKKPKKPVRTLLRKCPTRRLFYRALYNRLRKLRKLRKALQIIGQMGDNLDKLQHVPRLKPVHLYIPYYLQRNFRTLQVIIVCTPEFDDSFYAFSSSDVEAFYKTRGY